MKKIGKAIKAVWNYFNDAWEGEDGKLSYRRASQFVFIWLASFMVLTDKNQTQYGFYSLVALLVTFLLMAGIITAQQILSGLKTVERIKNSSTTSTTTTSEEVSETTGAPVEQIPE